MLKISLDQAMLDVNFNKVTLYFTSEGGYNLAWLSLKKMDICKYVAFGESSINVLTPYMTLMFWNKESAEAFFRNHVKQECDESPTLYADDNPICRLEPRVYLYLPEASAGIRGGKIPARTLKLDDLEEKRQEYKKLVNKYFGVANAQYDETEKLYNRFMKLNNISNFVCEYEMPKINFGPILIRSVQINEKKGVVTIVWRDGNVTMAKCGPHEEFDPEKGIAIAFMKRWFASTTKMNKWLKEQTKDYYERTLENGFEDEERLPLKDLVQDFIKNA